MKYILLFLLLFSQIAGAASIDEEIENYLKFVNASKNAETDIVHYQGHIVIIVIDGDTVHAKAMPMRKIKTKIKKKKVIYKTNKEIIFRYGQPGTGKLKGYN